MDNRNLSEKERESIETNRRATLAQRTQKDSKVVRDIDDLDEIDE